ncbi:hypothetical protein QBC37DRAFT_485511 [Rhypophila decipiens]|uniref:Uncharacterized protein n=1 Tax=Rhypophila decipiens TaxID=261697 RepID=A0AAN7B6V3_9PEZI|nr:hypothetical protein QBC37DRAFT_485511 [Rhypophila decipiens]
MDDLDSTSPVSLSNGTHYFASYQRVLRGKDTIENLIQAFPAVEQKLLTSSSPLTDHERRRLLDLPDAADEAENISRIGSSRSREELLSAAMSNPDLLSDDELQLLSNGFWSDNDMAQEDLDADDDTPAEEQDRIDRAREAASSSIHHVHELEAFEKATMASILRQKERDDEQQRAHYREQADRPIPTWMESLSQRIRADFPMRNTYWGYVAFLDAEIRALGEERLDLFFSSMDAVLYGAMGSNGACACSLDRSWRLEVLNAPDGGGGYSELRKVFRSLVDKDGGEESSSLEDGGLPVSVTPYGDDMGLSAVDAVQQAPGLLTNTFLVIDKTCVESVLDQPFLDDMRIIAVDADFVDDDATASSKDNDTCQGWTWVRIEQLANRFYGARISLEGEAPRVGIEEIWKAAQASRNGAFVAMDPEVARVWTESTTMRGQEQPFYGVE